MDPTYQRQYYINPAFIGNASLLAPGGPQTRDNALTPLGVHIFTDPDLHFVIPTLEDRQTLSEYVQEWEEGLAIQGDLTIRNRVNCHLWYPGTMDRSALDP